MCLHSRSHQTSAEAKQVENVVCVSIYFSRLRHPHYPRLQGLIYVLVYRDKATEDE